MAELLKGELWKRSDILKVWRPRYFTLHPGCLYYSLARGGPIKGRLRFGGGEARHGRHALRIERRGRAKSAAGLLWRITLRVGQEKYDLACRSPAYRCEL